jgi:hypothetical protein
MVWTFETMCLLCLYFFFFFLCWQQRKNFDYIFFLFFLFTLLFYHWWLGQIKSEEPRDPSFWEPPLQWLKLHNPDFAPQFKNLLHMHFPFPSATNNCPFLLWIAFHMSPSFWEKRKRKRIYIIKVFRWQFHAQNSSTLTLLSLSLSLYETKFNWKS